MIGVICVQEVSVASLQLVQDLESQLVDYEQETGYKFSVKKPTVSQVCVNYHRVCVCVCTFVHMHVCVGPCIVKLLCMYVQ